MTLTTTVGGAASNSFVTVAEYQAYGLLRGWSLSGADATDEINLLKSMDYLRRQYTYTGWSTTDTQALPFPRVMDVYINGYRVLTDVIPQQIADAQCEMAYLIQNGATPFATVTGGAVTKSSVKGGPVSSSKEYSAPREIPRFVAVEGLVEPFIIGGAGKTRLVRG